MRYEKDIKITADTAKSDETVTDIHITHGIIAEIAIDFPRGCHKRAHAYLTQGGHQFSPINPGGDFSGENVRIATKPNYDTKGGIPIISVHTWNTDEIHDHTLTIGLEMNPKKAEQTEVKGAVRIKSKIRKILGI